MSPRPTPPEEWECCESECSPCVWDTYREELQQWNAEQKALKEASVSSLQTKEDSEK